MSLRGGGKSMTRSLSRHGHQMKAPCRFCTFLLRALFREELLEHAGGAEIKGRGERRRRQGARRAIVLMLFAATTRKGEREKMIFFFAQAFERERRKNKAKNSEGKNSF